MRSLWLVALVGCYRPAPQVGAPCNAAGECPSPLACVDGLCVGEPGEDGSDGSPGGGDGAPGELVPSNGVDASVAIGLTTTITIARETTVDTDTGKLSGGFKRVQGQGVIAGIGYQQATFAGMPIAVFSFAQLDVTANGSLVIQGSRPAVFVIAGALTIDGVVHAGATCGSGNCPGPGGGAGTPFTVVGGGCGGGSGGAHDAAGADAGGGGGAGGENGAAGGSDTRAGVAFPGGSGGLACVPAMIEPLTGGSGGSGGGPGSVAPTSGGAGGGALQLTALGSITITGTVEAGGAGGSGGPGDAVAGNGGAGAGGGAGGALLLEAPTITLAASSVLAANGGGGGGAGSGATTGSPGAHGATSATPAAGGAPAAGGQPGGAGGAAGAPAQPGTSGTESNGGGGGGGAGRIHVRARSLTAGGTTSPNATSVSL